MKIGIVTFYGVANYGAMLQAYALWKFLEQRGYGVEFVDVSIYNPQRVPFWRCFLSRRIGAVKTKFTNYVQRHVTDFSSEYPQTRRFENIDDLRKNCPAYDVLIVGSDQVWNPKWCLNDIPIVFLDFAPKGCKRIAYAASFGTTRWSHAESAKVVGRLLGEFQAISVREKSGISIVNELSSRTAESVLDPTLLWDVDFYRKLMPPSKEHGASYVFNFVLHGWSDEILERACLDAVIERSGLQTVFDDAVELTGWFSALGRALDVKDRISLPVWLERIANAGFVVTNSFHGTVFSILFKRPFITPLIHGNMSGMNERVISLLEELNLADRMIDNECQILRALDGRINWEDVRDRLDVWRKKSVDFFSSNGL